jgi:hypothetical protein
MTQATTITTTQASLLLTLSGVATLAKVQRPTVSMWRTRTAGSGHPFPEPVRTEPQHLFDGEQVAAWLRDTGHGNNPDAEDELAVVASLDSPSGPEQTKVVHGLTALLALAVATGEELSTLTVADILELADDVDPHDHYLYTEVQALGEGILPLARHAERMAHAAYTPTEALESLVRRRTASGAPLMEPSPVTSPAAEVIARLTAALVAPDAVDATTFVDPFGCGDVLLALRGHLPEDADLTVAVDLRDGTPAARLYRRRLVAHGWTVAPLELDDDQFVLPRSCVVVAVLPFATGRSAGSRDALAVLDGVALAMGPGAQAVVLGPSQALVGRLLSPSARAMRDQLLRADLVRVIARLPHGLVTGSPRQGSAAWVLRPVGDGAQLAERRIAIADLSATALDAGVVDDLATDVVSAVDDPRNARRHAFRFARSMLTSELLASDGDLVGTPAPHARRAVDLPAEAALRVRELLAAVNDSPPGVLALDVEHYEAGVVRLVTLGELVGRRVARVLPGHRLRSADIMSDPTAGEVRVVGTPELLGASAVGARVLDRLTFSSGYPAARYTEPGDVVFCSTPGIGAFVDEVGLSVVQYPARVLRLAPETRSLVARLVALDIAAAPARTPWRTWPVRVVPPAQTAALGGALDRIAAERRRAADRLTALDALAAQLADGVTTGSLTLDPTYSDDCRTMNERG